MWNALAVVCIDSFAVVDAVDAVEGIGDSYSSESTPNCNYRKTIYNGAPPPERRRKPFWQRIETLRIETLLTPVVSFVFLNNLSNLGKS